MEYRLNKIDTEIRQKIQDSTKEGLIHSKQEVLIGKDKKREKKQQFDKGLKKYAKDKKNSNRFSIDAEKVEEIKVEAFINEENKSEISSGRFLDIKR